MMHRRYLDGGGIPGLRFRMIARGRVEDGVASRLDINAVRTGTDSLALAITIYQRDGNIHNIIFDDIWSELNG